MLKHSPTSLTLVFLILLKNVEHFGTHAAKEVIIPDTIYDDKVHHLAKRMDLQICLGQFDVHKNTIIRTGESQAIGGKYLQGLELDTMEECQRLCCETESCDVYIFESKKDGYCYLFECGTPENFHCKFTRHANYTSAVLTPVIRPMLEVTTPHPLIAHKSSSGISQQEWELSNLKIKPEIRDKSAEMGLPALGTNNMLGNGSSKKSLSVSPSTDMGQTQKVNSSVQCGRFQFACHSGECIAVYNACDGIPQCEDGSDEGPECSGANSNLSPSTKSSLDAVGVNNKVAAAPSIPQYQQVSLMQQSAQQQLQSMQQQPQHQVQTPIVLPSVPVVNNREDPNVWETRKIVSGSSVVGNGGNPESQNLNQMSTGGSGSSGDSFTAYVNNRPAPGQSVGVYAAAAGVSADGSGVSNGGSTLEQSGLYMSHVPPQDPNAVYVQQHILLPPPPPPPPAPLNSNWQQQAIMNQQKQQQQPQQQQQGIAMTQQQQLTLPQGPAGAAQQTQQQQVPNQSQQQQSAQILMPSLSQQMQSSADPKLATGPVNPSLPQNVVKTVDSEEYEDSEEKSTEPPKKHKHKKVKSKSKDLKSSQDANEPQQQLQAPQQSTATNAIANPINAIKTAASPVHEQYEIIHQNMALEFRDHDGQSERPGGAVLSLTLGLLITAALAILIGCRMRTVGRRARRLGGKTPYSHEADFLVNGMYL